MPYGRDRTAISQSYILHTLHQFQNLSNIITLHHVYKQTRDAQDNNIINASHGKITKYMKFIS